jgi:hypothetical protein
MVSQPGVVTAVLCENEGFDRGWARMTRIGIGFRIDPRAVPEPPEAAVKIIVLSDMRSPCPGPEDAKKYLQSVLRLC